jgi:hypothetical protein
MKKRFDEYEEQVTTKFDNGLNEYREELLDGLKCSLKQSISRVDQIYKSGSMLNVKSLLATEKTRFTKTKLVKKKGVLINLHNYYKLLPNMDLIQLSKYFKLFALKTYSFNPRPGSFSENSVMASYNKVLSLVYGSELNLHNLNGVTLETKYCGGGYIENWVKSSLPSTQTFMPKNNWVLYIP